MKKIEAIIRPTKLDEVRAALEKAGCPGIMITEIKGHGKQKGITQQWRGTEYRVDLLQKIKIEVIVKDADLSRIIKAIIGVTKTGEIGDGKIFVSTIENAIRIRTEDTGEAAI
jgi:nitrogen regulatory protein P-II 1